MQYFRLISILSLLVMVGCKGSKSLTSSPSSTQTPVREFPFPGQPGPESIDGLFVEASTYMMRGDLASASEEFQKILAIDPSHPASNYNLGKISLQNRQFSQALGYLQTALEGDGKNIWYRRSLVEVYEKQGNLQKALEAQTLIHQQAPTDRAEWSKLASLQYRLGKKEAAIQTLQAMQVELGESVSGLITAYEWFTASKQYSEAANMATKLLQQDPVNPKWRNMYYNAQVKAGNIEEADQSLEEWIALDPSSPQAQLLLSEAYRRAGNTALSEQYLLDAFRNPGMEETWKSRYIEEEMGKTDEKLLSALIEAMKEAHPGSTVANSFQARLQIGDQSDEQIRELLKVALDSDPESLKTWNQLLDLSFTSGRYDLLYVDSREAREMFPNEQTILFYYGIGAAAQGQYAKAQRVLTKIELLEPDDKLLLARSLSESARIAYLLEDLEESTRLLNKALQLNTGDEFVSSREAWITAAQGNGDNSTLRSARKFLQSYPTPAGQSIYAWVTWKAGDETEALAYVTKATSVAEVAEWLLILGDLELARGDKDAARAAYTRAREAGADINPDLRVETP